MMYKTQLKFHKYNLLNTLRGFFYLPISLYFFFISYFKK